MPLDTEPRLLYLRGLYSHTDHMLYLQVTGTLVRDGFGQALIRLDLARSISKFSTWHTVHSYSVLITDLR